MPEQWWWELPCSPPHPVLHCPLPSDAAYLLLMSARRSHGCLSACQQQTGDLPQESATTRCTVTAARKVHKDACYQATELIMLATCNEDIVFWQPACWPCLQRRMVESSAAGINWVCFVDVTIWAPLLQTACIHSTCAEIQVGLRAMQKCS